MTEHVNAQDAKTHLSALLKRVEAGESITIARAGAPVAALTPADPARPTCGGLVPGLHVPDAFFADLPDAELTSAVA